MGVQNAHPHRFRDTLAVDMLLRGASFCDSAKTLGTTVEIAERHYAPFVKEVRARVRLLLDAESGLESSASVAVSFRKNCHTPVTTAEAQLAKHKKTKYFVAAGPVSRILSAGRTGRTAIPLGRASLRGSSDLPGGLAHRAGTRPAEAGLPPYLVLLRVGFALPAALLRRRCALTAPFHPYPDLAAQAVYFLWHFPSDRLEPALPDVIRHTALRSSDFPPSLRRATVRPSCQQGHYIRCWSGAGDPEPEG